MTARRFLANKHLEDIHMQAGKRPISVLNQSLENATNRMYRNGFVRPEMIAVRPYFYDSLQPKYQGNNYAYMVPKAQRIIVLYPAAFIGQLTAGTIILDTGFRRANIRREVIRIVTEREVQEGLLVCEEAYEKPVPSLRDVRVWCNQQGRGVRIIKRFGCEVVRFSKRETEFEFKLRWL